MQDSHPLRTDSSPSAACGAEGDGDLIYKQDIIRLMLSEAWNPWTDPIPCLASPKLIS